MNLFKDKSKKTPLDPKIRMYRKTDVFEYSLHNDKIVFKMPKTRLFLFVKVEPPFREQLVLFYVFDNVADITIKKFAECFDIIPRHALSKT